MTWCRRMSPDSRGAPPPPSGVLLEQFFHLELQRQRHTSSPHMNDRKTPKIIKIASRIRLKIKWESKNKRRRTKSKSKIRPHTTDPWLQIWWPPLTTAPLGERTVAGEGGSGGLVRPGSAGGSTMGEACVRGRNTGRSHGSRPVTWRGRSEAA